MLLGYVAWCGRTFWVVVDSPDLSRIPADQRAAAEAAVEAAGLTKPDPFSPELMVQFLMKPYGTAPGSIGVSVFHEPERPPAREYLHVHRDRRNARSSEHPVVFFWSPIQGWALLTTSWGEVNYPGVPLAKP